MYEELRRYSVVGRVYEAVLLRHDVDALFSASRDNDSLFLGRAYAQIWAQPMEGGVRVVVHQVVSTVD
jgi:hypothetical protein